MKNELLLSAAILPMWYGRRSDTASPTKGRRKRKQRPNIVLFFWLTTWDGRILHCLSGVNGRITTTLPHAEHGTPGSTREDVHTSMLAYQLPHGSVFLQE